MPKEASPASWGLEQACLLCTSAVCSSPRSMVTIERTLAFRDWMYAGMPKEAPPASRGQGRAWLLCGDAVCSSSSSVVGIERIYKVTIAQGLPGKHDVFQSISTGEHGPAGGSPNVVGCGLVRV